MIRVAVPTKYDFSPSRGWIGRNDGLMWYAATGSPMVPPSSILTRGVYTNEDALYEQIGAEFSYTGSREEDQFFDGCRKQCKQEVGKGAEFRDCIRRCRGKGPKGSALRGMEAETDAELAEALRQASSDSSSERSTGGGSNTIMWIVIAVLILGIIGFGIYLMNKNKAAA